MTGLPDSLSIAFWVVGSCWVMSAIAYVCGVFDVAFPLVALGALTGLAEWIVRREKH
jgi:hypothetical protein